MDATDDRLKKFAHVADPKRRAYNAMMLAMDENIGRVRQQLTATGQEKDTLVVFISDNGGPTMPGVTVNASINTPLRGSKRTTLEGGIRVPFVLSWAGRVKPGVYDQPAIQLDLTYTALTAAGIAIQPEWKLDGTDLLPYLTGKKTGAPHDALYWRFGEQMAVRMGDFKLVRYDVNADTLSGARNQGVTAKKLYNLRDDLGETRDLAAAMPDKVRELEAKWAAWNTGNVPPLWGSGGGADNDGPSPGAAADKKGKRAGRKTGQTK
jgi:arylsulfatase A-like enzyme